MMSVQGYIRRERKHFNKKSIFMSFFTRGMSLVHWKRDNLII